MADTAVDIAMPQVVARPQSIQEYFRRLAFVMIAGFILIAPSMPQVFEVRSVFFRPWTMFSAVGVGLLKGSFIETDAKGEATYHDPAFVLGRKHYSRAMVSPHPYLVWSDAHLPAAAAPFCERLADGTTLSFDGFRQTRGGWVKLASGNVCEGL